MRRALAVCCLVVGACDLVDSGSALDAAPVDAGFDGYPPPVDDVVPPVGSATTLDVACWNIENFPATPTTPSLVASLITSLRLDVIVVEEIASEAAWDELLARLPEHDGVLSTHRYTSTSYQKIGVIYRSSIATVGAPELLFPADTYAFPRPPLRVPVTVGSLSFDVIGVHLKAGVSPDDGARRAAAARALDGYLRGQIAGAGDDEIMVLGDYNEIVTDATGMQVLAPLLAADVYRLRSAGVAASGAASFIPSGRVIDHILTTAGLDAEVGDAAAVIPRLDATIARYTSEVSDHLPVVLTFPMPSP